MNSIPKTISDSIKKWKWLYVSYLNQVSENTYFWCWVKDIISNKKLKIDMYNPAKSDRTIETVICLDKIQGIEILEFTNYDINENLIEKIENNLLDYEWLEYEQFNNNILTYLNECNKLNKDPFIVKYSLVSWIDKHSFNENRKINLEKKQENEIIDIIRQFDISKKSYYFNELALSTLSIDESWKKYLVWYYNIT